MPSVKPILVVLGATGNQGGSILSYFLSLQSSGTSPYTLRGITRDPTSEKSTKLSTQGVEMIGADINNPTTLTAAFKGATAIYSVTNFWQNVFNPAVREKATAIGQGILQFSRDLEAQQNKNIIDAAAKVDTLERFIFSSLPDANKLSGGKYPDVYHFDGKGIAEEYGRSVYPQLWKKTTVFYAGFYLENFLGPEGGLLRPKLVCIISLSLPVYIYMYMYMDMIGLNIHPGLNPN